MRPPDSREIPAGDPTDSELAAIARHLRTALPGLHTPVQTIPPHRPPGQGRAIARFLAASLVPALVMVAIMLAFGPRI